MTKPLPSNPNLQHLRAQAKDLLKAGKREDPEAAVGLQECQHALAKEYGFKNWAELKAYVESEASPATEVTCRHPLLLLALRQAVERKASDVHLVAGEPLSFRVAGALERSEGEAISAEDLLAAAVAQFGDDVAARAEKAGGIQAVCGLSNGTRGQATVTMSAGRVRIAIAIIGGKVLDYKEAGLPQGLLDVATQKSGLIVFAGREGSGFRTSATSFVDYINQTQPVHILTIEDPIRGRLIPKRAIIQQREVGTDTPDIVSAMRIGVVQDVDVLYVAALRATQELVSVITAAEMGRLVVIPVHGNSFDEVIERIVSAFPAGDRDAYRKRLSRVLRSLSVQKLLARIDRPGRVAAYGLLVPDERVRTAIEKGDSLDSLDDLPEGSQRMSDHISKLQQDGVVE